MRASHEFFDYLEIDVTQQVANVLQVLFGGANVAVDQSDQLDERFRLVHRDGDLVVRHGHPVRGRRTEKAGAQVGHVRLDGPPRRPEPVVVARRVGGHLDQRPVTRHVRSQGQVRLVLVQQRAHRHPRELVLAHRHPVAAAAVGFFDFVFAVVGGGFNSFHEDRGGTVHGAGGRRGQQPMGATVFDVHEHVPHQGDEHGGHELLLVRHQFRGAEHPFPDGRAVNGRQPFAGRSPVDAHAGRHDPCGRQPVRSDGRYVVEVQTARPKVLLSHSAVLVGEVRPLLHDGRHVLQHVLLEPHLIAPRQTAATAVVAQPPRLADGQVPVQLAGDVVDGPAQPQDAVPPPPPSGHPGQLLARPVGVQVEQPQPPGRRKFRAAAGHEQHALHQRPVTGRQLNSGRRVLAAGQRGSHRPQVVGRVVTARALELVHRARHRTARRDVQ